MIQAAKTEVGLDQYWLIIKRRWFPAAVIFGSTVAAFAYWGSIQTPIHEAQGKLRIKSSDTTSALTGLSDLDDERGQLSSLNDEESPIETEIELMTTAPMVRAAIDRINYRDEEGEPIRVDQFQSNLDIGTEGSTDILNVTYQSADVELAEAAVNSLMSVYLEQNLRDNRAEAVAAREFIEDQLPDAERRALQAEAALRDFKERNQIISLDLESEETVSSLNGVRDKITDVSAQLYEATAQFNLIRDRIGQDPQTALLATAVSQSEGVQQVLEEAQKVEATLAAERVRFQEGHPVIVDLKTKINNLDRLLDARIQNVVGSGGLPASANLQRGAVEIGLVSDYIRLESRLVGLRQTAQTLINAEDAYASKGSQFPRLEQEQRELQRRLDAAQSTYTSLLQRLQEVRVFENKNVGNARIVQPAESMGIVAPNQDRYVTTGMMLGAFLALTTALLLETSNRSIKTVKEARETFRLPVLGVIPSFYRETRTNFRVPVLGVIPGLGRRMTPLPTREVGGREIPPLVTGDAHASLASESFHMLRNNLKFLNSDNPPRIIAITSTGPSEGKSTVASNLAASIAHTGQKVLLVDADLHRPMQHWIWDVASRYGLSDFLVDHISLSDALVLVQPNLTLLLAGSLPPDPASLLDSKKMVAFLEALRSTYDYVILDAPSLRSVASTSILGKLVDGLLMVVRPGVADKNSVGHVRELIRQSKQNVLGIVVNGTLSKYEPYSYFLSEDFYGETTMEEETMFVPASPVGVGERRR